VADVEATLVGVKKQLVDEEKRYAAMLEDVKAEHADALQKVFDEAKSAADAAHGQALSGIRAQQSATIEQLKKQFASQMEDLKSSVSEAHQAELSTLSKELSNQKLELEAARGDLAKTKSARDTLAGEHEALKKQLADVKAKLEVAEAAKVPDLRAELQAREREVQSVKDDLTAAQDALKQTNEMFVVQMEELNKQHDALSQESAAARGQEVTKLKAEWEKEKTALSEQLSRLKRDLEDEREQKERALAAATVHTPPMSPRRKQESQSQATVDHRKDLAELHTAHQQKLAELEQAYEKEKHVVIEQNDALRKERDDAIAQAGRAKMEAGFVETERDEALDEVAKLKEELETLRQQAHA